MATNSAMGWESPDKNKLLQTAKRQAKAATEQGAVPHAPFPVMKSTMLNKEQMRLRGERCIPEGVGRFSKAINAALPGAHTQKIYEEHSWKERSTLAQLRTDMVRLNGYLHRIKAVSTGQCACGEARETVEHFLLRCPQWDEQRRLLREDASTKWRARRGKLHLHHESAFSVTATIHHFFPGMLLIKLLETAEKNRVISDLSRGVRERSSAYRNLQMILHDRVQGFLFRLAF